MIWLVALLAISSAPASLPAPPTAARVEATATVRILSAARLTLDGSPNPGLPAARDSIVRDQGVDRPAKLK
jgi:hypothetical protein